MKKKQVVFSSAQEALSALTKCSDKFRVYRVSATEHRDYFVIALSPRAAFGEVGELFGLEVELVSQKELSESKVASLSEFARALTPAKRKQLLEALNGELV